MHELAICEAIANAAAKRADGRPVSQVTVQVGHFRQVVPDALLFSWEMVSSASSLEGSELVVEQVPAVVHCRDCGAKTTLDLPILSCRACGGFEVDLISGEELALVSLHLTGV